MALVKHVTSQTDFSAGQVDPTLKRDDEHPARKAGLRQCANFRMTNGGGVANRFGRSAQFLDGPRVDEVLMGPGAAFTLCFSAGVLNVRSAGAIVFTTSSQPWTALNVGQIVWAVYQSQVFITFPGMQPLVLTWAGGTSFSIANFAEEVLGSQKRTPFYRISPQGITMAPSAIGAPGASVTLTFSAGMTLTASYVGTRMRFVGRQLLITAVASAASATATLEETIFSGYTIATNSTADIRESAGIGDVVIGSVSGAKAQITAFVDATHFQCQMLNGNLFQTGASDHVVGPGGDLGAVTAQTNIGPQAVTDWDDEVMNSFRGWPASCAVDQNRLILSNFPSVPSGICWSAVGLPTDLYDIPTAPTADNAIFELVPGKSQVYFVAAGAESDEFVFCDNATYWVPISVTNPLAPGSVAFNQIDEGCAQIQPRFLRGAIIYVNAGANMVRTICATGAYNRPYESRSLTDFHQALFNSIAAIAAPTADGQFPERYFYVLNGDGTAVGCKVKIEDGQIKEPPGWFRIFDSFGTINWISARLANVWFVATYTGASGPMAELLDNTQYLDMAFAVNAPPTQLVPPGGKGPLWFAPSQPVTLMDLGTRQMGVYQIDGNGFIVPQNIGGENLLSAQLVAGHHWTATMEPFIPSPPAGQDISQRLVKRQVAQALVYVMNSTGFLWAWLFSGTLLPVTAAGYMPLGTIVKERRVTTYNQDDDATKPPPLREEADLYRPIGSSFDPRIAIIKDTAGPLTVAEIAMEVTV